MKLDRITTFSLTGPYSDLFDLPIAERELVLKLARDYAKYFIGKASDILDPARDILPETYAKSLEVWQEAIDNLGTDRMKKEFSSEEVDEELDTIQAFFKQSCSKSNLTLEKRYPGENRLHFYTRENGDVGQEKYSDIDLKDATRVEKLIKKRFPNVNIYTDTSDEWVILDISIATNV
tara:strand:+ start:47812 stop:48345 length:534 start_codon:yes stop_codon:yes gene_type:complete